MPTIEDLLREAYTSWDDAAVLGRVGRELQSRCRFPDAEAVLGRAVELAPDDVVSWANLSYAQFRSLRDGEGRATLERGIEASGSHELTSILMSFTPPDEGERLAASIDDTEDPVARAALIARRFHAAEEETERKTILEELRAHVAAHEEHERVVGHLLWALLGGRHAGAVDDDTLRNEGLPAAWGRARAKPGSMHGWWFLLQLMTLLEDWPGVLEASAEALTHLPDEETVMVMRGRAYRELEDDDRAAQCFLRAIGAKPTYAGARAELGRLYEKQGKLELAEEVFREMPVANPDYAMAPISLALFLTRQDRLDEAESVFVDAWPTVPEIFRPSVTQNPEAKPLLERAQVKELLEA